MFHQWVAFYQLTGAAAASLIGLLFIVATLSSRQSDGPASGVRLFLTPMVFHLALVLAVSAVALAPSLKGPAPAALMGLFAVTACAYAVPVALGVARIQDPTHWSDAWYYGAAPVAADLALAVASASAWAGWSHAGDAVALTVLAILLLAIRNAWDLVTWLSARRAP